jgi:hypothetical protein
MKKLIIPTLTGLITMSALANGPMSPMEGYEITQISSNDISTSELWNSLRTDLKNEDCYKRAQLWTHSMDQNYNVKSKKIFMHYTNKFNRELDGMGGLGWFAKKFFNEDGVSSRNEGLVQGNITWDYHVAPVVNIDGEDVVLDRTLALAYDAKFPHTDNEAWTLTKRPSTPEEWVESLTVRGEILWKVRKQLMLNQIKELEGKVKKFQKRGKSKTAKKYQAKVAAHKLKMTELEMDNQDSIDIQCQKVDSIVEADAAQLTAWCFYSEAPMYYYSQHDLRYLAYGNIKPNYRSPVPVEYHTEENFQAGRDNYVQTRFSDHELEDAQGEIKPERN